MAIAAWLAMVAPLVVFATADQLVMTLGVWKHGIIPGILTTQQIAPDVTTANLEFLLAHKDVGTEGMDAAILNSKGFGGNNATASILSPAFTCTSMIGTFL